MGQGQSQSSWQPEAKKVRPQQTAEKSRLQPVAGKGSGKSKQELQRKTAAVEEHTNSKKKQTFHAYASKDNNLVLTVSLDAITRIG